MAPPAVAALRSLIAQHAALRSLIDRGGLSAVSTVIEDLKQLEDRILARIEELEANVAELEQLRDVAARLGILDRGRVADAPATAPANANPAGVATATRPRRRRTASRARASGTKAHSGGARSATRAATTVPARAQSTRRERVLDVVGVEPGISVREIVAQLGVNRTSLYPVVRQLVSDGLVYKDGPGLWPVPR
jgi:hypothetical protein